MKTIIKNYKEKFGYTPTIYELHSLFTQGMLTLSDEEENTLIKEFKTKKQIIMTTEEFECYLINILDSEKLTDAEKIKLIRQYI
tara:strand:+ start:179 stop:430 length:252 start_codon:yes stop_codon:yes gene_type:complete